MLLGHSFLKILNHTLPPSVRFRGRKIYEAYADGGSQDLQLVHREEDRVSATFQGSEKKPYKLSLTVDKSKTRPSVVPACSCPFFKSYDGASGCKHLYGLVLLLCDLEKSEGAGADDDSTELSIDSFDHLDKSDGLRLLFLLHLDEAKPDEGLFVSPVLQEKSDPVKIVRVADSFLREVSWPFAEQVWVDRAQYHTIMMKTAFVPHEGAFRIPGYWHDGILNDLLDQQRLWMSRGTEGGIEQVPVKNGLHKPVSLRLKGVSVERGVQVEMQVLIQGVAVELPPKVSLFEKGLFLLGDTLYQMSDPELSMLFARREEFESRPLSNEEAKEVVLDFLELKDPDLLDFPAEYDLATVQGRMTPALYVGVEGEYRKQITAGLAWQYENVMVLHGWEENPVLDPDAFCWVKRDADAEAEALSVLTGMEEVAFLSDLSAAYEYRPHLLAMRKKEVFPVIRRLVEQGWQVHMDHQTLTAPDQSQFDLSTSSGIDWFDVQASVAFGDQKIELPALLKAMRKGESVVSLEDGKLGVLPESMVQSLRLLTRFGETDVKAGTLRFQGAQSILLDHLLDQLPGISWNEERSRLRDQVKTMKSPGPHKAPPEFQGTLRPYQEEGLGWLIYLQNMGIQGCLADDMGLGKTVQVLALLEQRRQNKAGPSLLVMPKSLVHNWLHEAAQFTPKLKVAALVGSDRPTTVDDLPKAQVYITTYPLIQRDIPWLKNQKFDYAILDESQAIKNANTKTAKACRLIQAEHRLTMTGTPVENRLDDLWSQFEFLNPGLLRGIASTKKTLSAEELSVLGRAVRPFLLRRTKEQVVKDLPEKVEETLFCEMTSGQHAAYQDLKTYYQKQLTSTVKQKGLNKSKIMVLEALLRLRQAACHPGLLDPKQRTASCGKLDILKDMLSEIVPAGHKALIFSQFTSFLDLTKLQLEKEGYSYAYLDGKSKDRAEQIERFQTQEDCNLFLISLKAGGVGLNLTAADYVFLLDPWWNPAIEAQAIDRAHRIGQQRSVFAYRIVAENTIEDKILQLQSSKKELADAILSEETSLLTGLTMDDLNFLLG